LAKIDRVSAMPKTNDEFDLEPTRSVATVSKAQTMTPAVLSQIGDPWVRWSVALQIAFGLRMEEALKIHVWESDQGDRLVVTRGTKGGRDRIVPIRTPAQRDLLDQIKAFVPTKASSLIPAHLAYHTQRDRYVYHTRAVGLTKLHGLRHAYAATRFAEEAGYAAPLAGGLSRKTMTREERQQDTGARRTVSEELGHSRPRITATYIGT
jgi:integrase